MYGESNLLLEIALEQEQAEAGLITLAIPSFAISEPFTTLAHRRFQRTERIREFQHNELNQLRRSLSQRRAVESLSILFARLENLAAEQIKALETIVARVLATGRTIDINSGIFQSALALEQELDLSAQDSVILASILGDLAVQPIDEEKCFVSANWKDFRDRRIRDRLQEANCRYIGSFHAAREFLDASLRGDALDLTPDDER